MMEFGWGGCTTVQEIWLCKFVGNYIMSNINFGRYILMIGSIILGLVGIVLIAFGYLVWKKEKISLFHDYHYEKVSEEDKKVFCTISGIEVVLIGIGILTTAIIIGITDSFWSFIAFVVGFVVGLIMLIYAGIRYNH